MVSIKEAIERLQISRNGLNKWIKKLGISKVKRGRMAFIEDADLQKIIEARKQQPNMNTETNTETKGVHDMVGILSEELQEKNRQIATKDEQIERLQQALNQAQLLHGRSEQRIDELTARVRLLEPPPAKLKINVLEWWRKFTDKD